MKKRSIAALCLCAALLCSACHNAPASSGGQGSSAPEAASDPAASSAPSSAPQPLPPASAPSAPEAPEEPSVPLSAAPSFISLPVTAPDGSEGEKALVIVRAPEGWVFDQYTTFSRGEIKIAEFPRLWQTADAAAPFSEQMLAPYQSDDSMPGDAVSAEDLTLNDRPLRVLHLPTWMDGSEEPWFLHCAFYALDGYVVEAHLYTTQEWGGSDSEELLAALGALELHFSEESAQGA